MPSAIIKASTDCNPPSIRTLQETVFLFCTELSTSALLCGEFTPLAGWMFWPKSGSVHLSVGGSASQHKQKRSPDYSGFVSERSRVKVWKDVPVSRFFSSEDARLQFSFSALLHFRIMILWIISVSSRDGEYVAPLRRQKITLTVS